MVSRQCFNLTTLDDNLLESNERLFLNLETEDPMVTLAPPQATVTIVEADRK